MRKFEYIAIGVFALFAFALLYWEYFIPDDVNIGWCEFAAKYNCREVYRATEREKITLPVRGQERDVEIKAVTPNLVLYECDDGNQYWRR